MRTSRATRQGRYTFNYARAVHQVLRRGEEPLVVRHLFQAALGLFRDYFLNLSPAWMPGDTLAGLPTEREALLAFTPECSPVRARTHTDLLRITTPRPLACTVVFRSALPPKTRVRPVRHTCPSAFSSSVRARP